MLEKDKISEDVFDNIADRYDFLNRVLSMNIDKKWRAKLVSKVANSKKGKLLDLATGTADLLIALAQARPKLEKLCGIDLSRNMLEKADQKIKNLNLEERTELLYMDAQELKLEDESFEYATMAFGIRNVPEPINCFKEVLRVLKPYGKFLILELSIPKGLLKPFYLFYLRSILPKLGNLVSGSTNAYSYLNQSVEDFTKPEELCELARISGFKKAKYESLSLGICTLYIFEK